MKRAWHIRFTAHVVPLPQPRARARIIWPENFRGTVGRWLSGRSSANRPAEAFIKWIMSHTHPSIYTPADDKIHAFKHSIALAARAAHPGSPLPGPLRCDLIFCFPRPKSRTRKTLPNPRYHHVTTPDEDNVRKAVYDALKGILWKDDKQICQGWFDSFVAAGDEEPFVAVDVSAAVLQAH